MSDTESPTRERLLELVGDYLERLELIGDEAEADAIARELGFEPYGARGRSELESPSSSRERFSSYVSAARDLAENLPDSLPITDEIRSTLEADEVLRVFREHAEALEREREQPVWIIPAPWDGPTLELEPEPEHMSLPISAVAELVAVAAEPGDREPELARLMLAAGALYAVGAGSLCQCMRTALLWERG